MDEAPRPVPPYGDDIHSRWYYCLHCKHYQAAEYSMVSHVRTQHSGGDPEFAIIEGEDYTNGTHLRIMQYRWLNWSRQTADAFVTHLDSLRGADDFAFEVGDGVRDA